jgi:hypothetical protein
MKGKVGGSTTFLSKLNNEKQCLMPKCWNAPGRSGYCDKCLGAK